MKKNYIVRAGKLVTASHHHGTLYDAAIIVNDSKIAHIGKWQPLRRQYSKYPVHDYSSKVISPSLVDCHTHLMEFAPFSLYPVTSKTQFNAAHALTMQALASGITALGEQICGHPESTYSIADFKKHAKAFPVDITFAVTSISIGFEQLAHFSAVTKNKALLQENLTSEEIYSQLATHSEYPGENLFINATPANFTAEEVPRAGELIYTKDELAKIVRTFHQYGRRIGVHVAGEEGIDMCLDAGVDVLHHAHNINDEQIRIAADQQTKIVATPLGGTHLKPNSPIDIKKLAEARIDVSIATDAYLPPYPNVPWLPFKSGRLLGPDVLMKIAAPSMRLLREEGMNENEIMKIITANPASILNKRDFFGALEEGMEANFIVSKGLPALDFTDPEDIEKVYFRGELVINRRAR